MNPVSNPEKVVPAEPSLDVVRRYMKQGVDLNIRIRALEQQLSFITAQAFSLPSLSGISHATAHASPSSEAGFVLPLEKKDSLEQVLALEHEMLQALRRQIVGVIHSCTSGKENMALTCCYVSGMKWNETAEELKLSVKQTRRVVESALMKIRLPKDAIWISDPNKGILSA